MLAGVSPVYVDRFARAWHRLSTADMSEPHVPIIRKLRAFVKRERDMEDIHEVQENSAGRG